MFELCMLDGGIVGFFVDIIELMNVKEDVEWVNLVKFEFLDVMSYELCMLLIVVLGGIFFFVKFEFLFVM